MMKKIAWVSVVFCCLLGVAAVSATVETDSVGPLDSGASVAGDGELATIPPGVTVLEFLGFDGLLGGTNAWHTPECSDVRNGPCSTCPMECEESATACTFPCMCMGGTCICAE